MVAAPEILAGARNCVLECGGVGKGQEVLLLNEIGGRVEAEAVDVLAMVVESVGGRPHLLWTPRLQKAWWEDVPRPVLAAFAASDVVIHNHFTIGRPHRAIDHAIFTSGMTFVRNYGTTLQVLGSDWARFPLPLYNEIERRVNAQLRAGRRYRVVTDAGTDVEGELAGLWREDHFAGVMNLGPHRVFPPGVHLPADSKNASGVLLMEGTYSFGARLWGLPEVRFDPVQLTIENDRVVHIEGGADAEKVKRAFDFIATQANVGDDAFCVRSWHTGTHHKVFIPQSSNVDADHWQRLAHHHSNYFHFHIGGDSDRDYSTPYMTHLAANCYDATVYVDGVKMLDCGRLTVLDDPEVRRMADEYGDADELLAMRQMWF